MNVYILGDIEKEELAVAENEIKKAGHQVASMVNSKIGAIKESNTVFALIGWNKSPRAVVEMNYAIEHKYMIIFEDGKDQDLILSKDPVSKRIKKYIARKIVAKAGGML